jgi:CheY-like chemotaxis protein
MAHLPSFLAATLPLHRPEPQSITASHKSALLVEDDKSLVSSFRGWLERDGYAVRTASNTKEGLRLYRDCRPFNVVLINYYAPPREGVGIDCLAPQIHGVQLAMAIRDIDPSQGIIIAALDYRSVAEVPLPPRVMNIPLLIDIGNGQLRSLLEKIEVERAIEALTAAEFLRLQQFAKFRIRGLGRAARGRDWEDLLEEALCRMLIGAEDTQNGRHWNRRVSFVQHLKGAISSIASVWKRQFKEERTYLMSELVTYDAEGHDYSPIDNVLSRHVPADQHLIDKDKEDRVLVLFEDDPVALQLLQGLMDDLKKTEIMSRHGLDEKKYAAALRRIRLKLLDGRNDCGRG